MRVLRRLVPALLAAAVSLMGVVGCSSDNGPDPTILRNVPPGETVYADLWDEEGDEGDRALLERNLNDVWVVPEEAETFPRSREGADVRMEVTVDRGQWVAVVTDLGNTQVGIDHETCLQDDQISVRMEIPAQELRYESVDQESNDGEEANDDCAPGGDDAEEEGA